MGEGFVIYLSTLDAQKQLLLLLFTHNVINLSNLLILH